MNIPNITYNKDLKLVTVSPSTWTATPLTRWFDDYYIISSIDNPLAKKLKVIDIRAYARDVNEPLTTVKNIFASTALNELESRQDLSSYSYVMNRAGSEKMGAHRKKLSNDIETVSHFENKAWFRRTFKDTLRFAPFVTVDLAKLADLPYDEFVKSVGKKMVLQHPALAGSRGTYIVGDENEYRLAVSNLLQARDVLDEPIVVSQFLGASMERTMQGCVTSTDILIGPAQAQLIRHPELTADLPGEIQFCGGRIAPGLVTDEQQQDMQNAMKIVGSALQEVGYRGIFGMDFLIHEGAVFVLETNPRMTGLTPLLANIQNEKPFLLLHVLELAKQDYTLSEFTGTHDEVGGSFIQIYAQKECKVEFTTGLYDGKLNKIDEGFENGKMLPDEDGQFFVGMRVSPGVALETGKSIAFVYSKQQLFDDAGDLAPEAKRLVELFRKKYIKSL